MALVEDVIGCGDQHVTEQVFFMHVPKTGGRTVIRHLQEWFGEAVVEVPTNEDVVGTSGWETKPVICGHQFYPFRELVAERPLTLLVLRDPVGRVLSAFKYVDRKADHVLHEAFRSRIGSLRDFMMDDEFRFHSVNIQVRMLGCSADLRNLIEGYRSSRLTERQCREMYSAALSVEADEEMLATAKERLASEEVIFGVTEQMADFIGRVAFHLQKNIPNAVYIENVAPVNSSPDLGDDRWPPSDLDFVIHENRLDSELYAYALDVLSRRRDSPGKGL